MKSKQIQEFKETEIGKIPVDWTVKKLQDHLIIKGRIGWKGLKKSEFSETGDCIIVNGTDIKNGEINWDSCLRIPKWRYDESPEIKLRNGDILMTKDGTIGKTCFLDDLTENATVASGIFVIRNNSEDLLQNFFFVYLNSFHFKSLVNTRIEGSVIPHLYQRDLTQLLIPLPTLPEQEKICSHIENLNSKIKNLQNQNKILEQTAQAIFKSWFVDFDGVIEFENSELGLIPKGWKVIPFNELGKCVKGFSYKGIEKFDFPSGFEFVTLNSIKEGGGFQKKFTWLESDRLKEKHFVKELDLVIANTEQTKDGRLLATPALVQFSDDYVKKLAVYSHHITRIDSKFPNSKFYLYSHFRRQQKIIANAYSIGTGVWGFDDKGFSKNYLIIKPTSEILNNFEKFSFEIHSKIIKNEKSISVLSKIRDVLLPKLMSGEIRV